MNRLCELCMHEDFLLITLSSYGQIKGLKCTGKWLSTPCAGLCMSVYNITNQF